MGWTDISQLGLTSYEIIQTREIDPSPEDYVVSLKFAETHITLDQDLSGWTDSTAITNFNRSSHSPVTSKSTELGA